MDPSRGLTCADCGAVERLYLADRLCHRCYCRRYRNRITECSSCGSRGRNHRKGLCPPCFCRSPHALALMFRRLKEAKLVFVCRLVRRFFSFAMRLGYAPETLVPYSRRLARLVVDSKAKSARAFALTFTDAQEKAVLAGNKHFGLSKLVVHFLEDARLVASRDWPDLVGRGRIRAVLCLAPAPFQGDLVLYANHLEEERAYRGTSGELPRRRKTDTRALARLAFFAEWLDDRGLTSWEELTPERFRSAVRTGGMAAPTVSDNLSRLQSFMTFLAARKRIVTAPLAGMRPPPLRALAEAVVTPAELHRLVTLIVHGPVDPLPRLIGALVVFHGLGMAELMALKLADYDPRTRALTLRRRRIDLQLDPITRDAVVAYLATRRPVPGRDSFFTGQRPMQGERPTEGFFHRQLHRIGIWAPGRFRRALIQQVLRTEQSLVARRLFGLSTSQIDKYLCLLGDEKLFRFQSDRARVQDRL